MSDDATKLSEDDSTTRRVSEDDDLKATVTRAFAATVADDSLRRPKMSGEADMEDPEAPLPAKGELVGGTYKLVSLLGEGMFGKVYSAQRVDVPEHRVAIKIVARAHYQGRNVERELVMLATVGHPHVVQLKDHGTTADYVWLTMPVYQGETLAKRLERGPLTLREAYDVFLPIAHGLEALHDAGLRHQDIKPDNIYLAVFVGRGHPILLDLGVAAEKEATFCAGTALFASPEQLLALTGVPGAIPLTEKMDTYCFATTLLVSLVGGEHFPGDKAKTRDEIAEAHDVRAKDPLAEGALFELRGKPRVMLNEMFKKMLALDPADRPAMGEVAEMLEVLLEDEREAERAETRRRERQKANLRRVSLGLGLMVVGGIGAAGYTFSKRETLRLAGELEKARAVGAESFDKLDTCVASHTVAKREAATCERSRQKEGQEYKQQLDDIVRTGSATQADHAAKAQALETSYKGRVRACEDSAEEAGKAAAGERERIVAECAKDKATLTGERDARVAEVATLTTARDQCNSERSTCLAQREACETRDDPYAKPAAPPAPTGPLVPATVAGPMPTAPVLPPPGTGGPAVAPPPPATPPPAPPAPPPAPPGDPYP